MRSDTQRYDQEQTYLKGIAVGVGFQNDHRETTEPIRACYEKRRPTPTETSADTPEIGREYNRKQGGKTRLFETRKVHD